MEKLIRAATATFAAEYERATAAYQQTMQQATAMYEYLLLKAQAEYERQLMIATKGEDAVPEPLEPSPAEVETVEAESSASP